MQRHLPPVSLLTALLLLGVGLQLLMFLIVIDARALVWIDPREIYRIALELANGLPFSSEQRIENLERAPGYPFLLSLLIRAFGPDLLLLRSIHLLLLPLLLLAMYYLVAVWRDRQTALIAVLLSACYPYYLYIPLTLYPEAVLLPLFVILGAVTVRAGERTGYSWLWLLSGLIAAATLIRPTAVIWIPVALLLLCHGRRSADARPWSMRAALRIALVLTLLPALAVAGWMLRNQLTHGVALFTTTDQRNLLMSYNDNAAWYLKTLSLPPELQSRLDAADDLGERRRIVFSEVAAFIQQQPLRALNMALMRCLGLWSPLPITETFPVIAKFSLLNAVERWLPGLIYGGYLLLALAGLRLLYKDRLFQALILLVVLNTLINGVFLVSVRFRVVTDFVLIMAASVALQQLAARYMRPPPVAKPHY